MRAIKFYRNIQSVVKQNRIGLYRFCTPTKEQEAAEEQKLADFEKFITDHEINSDSKYRDMTARFEREWTQYVVKEQNRKIEYIEKELYEEEVSKLDYLFKEMKTLTPKERQYFLHVFMEKTKEHDGINPLAMNTQRPMFHSMCKS